MRLVRSKSVSGRLGERLATAGFRSTPQRTRVYQVLMAQADHPTAESVFLRAKLAMPEISLATVYNCLDALIRCGLAKQVTVGRGATRYCANQREHYHFCCERCGGVFDLEPAPGDAAPGLELPRGFRASQLELAVRGVCPGCAKG
jgi:Fur family peroxide stress response transcriptional regulator